MGALTHGHGWQNQVLERERRIEKLFTMEAKAFFCRDRKEKGRVEGLSRKNENILRRRFGWGRLV